jgi:hypothetical protein
MFQVIQFLMMCGLLAGSVRLAYWVDDHKKRRSGRI